MKQTIFNLCAIVLFSLSLSIHAQVIYERVNITAEGASFEVLYNPEKDSGSIIFKIDDCSSCSQQTITFKNPASVTVFGFKPEKTGLYESFSGKGDISYNRDTKTLDNLNIFQ